MSKMTATLLSWCIGTACTYHRRSTEQWRKGHRWCRREAHGSILSLPSRAEPAGITPTPLQAKTYAEAYTLDSLDSSTSTLKKIWADMTKRFLSQRISGIQNSSACRT